MNLPIMDEDAKVLYLGELQTINVKPGDTVVISYPMQVSNADKEAIASRLKKIFPHAGSLIIDCGGKVGVLGQ